MNLGYIYNYQDYEDLIRSGFNNTTLLHSSDIPLDKRGFYVGIGLQLYQKEDGSYYFVSDLSKVPHHRLRSLAIPRHVQDLLLLQAICNKYIPVYDTNGNLLITKENFNDIRRKMSGLSEYDAGLFQTSPNLDLPGIDSIIKDAVDSELTIRSIDSAMREKAISIIEQQMGLSISSSYKENSCKLVNTGSTGRGTNVPNDMDFDYAIIMDLGKFIRTLYSKSFVNVSRLQQLLQNGFVQGIGSVRNITTARLRLANIPIEYDGKEEGFDIDFSFFSNEKEFFSTVDSLEQRLHNIRIQSEDEYRKIVANIIYAKMVLKKNNAYKPSRSDKSQGGLGGVGIENWILQHGGSFIDAATSFITVADKYIKHYNVDLNDIRNYDDNAKGTPVFNTFIAFQAEYPVFDFGKSIESVSKGNFPYDNFVMRNMRTSGFLRTYSCLKNQLDFLKQAGFIADVEEKTI